MSNHAQKDDGLDKAKEVINLGSKEEVYATIYKNFDLFEYDIESLAFLRQHLDAFAIECFKQVVPKRDSGGLYKSQLSNYQAHRKLYDFAFHTLEVQGFIEPVAMGVSKRYFPTVRGFQLIKFLQVERDMKKSLQKEENENG